MADNYGSDYITIVDEDGTEFELEVLMSMEYNGSVYQAVIPAVDADEDADLEVMNGRYGPYLSYKQQNYKLPKNMHDRAESLTYEECMEIINNAPAPAAKTVRRKK